MGAERFQLILERVRATPAGFVTTYGDVSPGAPRLAGRVLRECDDPLVPWHRVVRSDGTLAKGERQRRLLAAEGVPFTGERVEMRVARLPPELARLPPELTRLPPELARLPPELARLPPELAPPVPDLAP